MPITTVNEDDPITAVKMNEIINAINAIAVSSVNFNGVGTIGIRSVNGNIAGVSRESGLPGAYRITFITPRSNADYAFVASCSINQGNDTGFVTLISQFTGYCVIYCRNDDGGANDCEIVSVLIVGN